MSSFSDLSMGRNFFFLFSRGFRYLVSPTMSVAHFFVFLVSCFLGSWEKSSPWQTSIVTAFTPPHFILISELLFLATEPSEKMYNKNNSITHLFRHSVGLMFLLVCRGFGYSSLNLEPLKVISNIKLYFSKMDCLSNTLLYNKYVCLKVFAPSKRQYCITHDKIPLKTDVDFLWKKQILFCRMPHYSSWQLLHATETAFLVENMVFLWANTFIWKVHFSLYNVTGWKKHHSCSHALYLESWRALV